MHGQAPYGRVQARAFGHGPALEGSVYFQAKVIMQASSIVLLDTELEGMLGNRFPTRSDAFFYLIARRLRRSFKVTPTLILIQGSVHGSPLRLAIKSKALGDSSAPRNESFFSSPVNAGICEQKQAELAYSPRQ
ncbi:hypothetical protein CFII64_00010 [Pseudomonas sp. CFII64]|nr:hypothetical protein CFII64_00010 [Pseudomonas sp. CFII64]